MFSPGPQFASVVSLYDDPTTGVTTPKSIHESKVLATEAHEEPHRLRSPCPAGTPPVVFVNCTAIYWFKSTATGAARAMVVKVNVVTPDTPSTSRTVNDWPELTVK